MGAGALDLADARLGLGQTHRPRAVRGGHRWFGAQHRGRSVVGGRRGARPGPERAAARPRPDRRQAKFSTGRPVAG